MEGTVELISVQPVMRQVITYADGRIEEQNLHIIYRIKNENNI